MRKIDVILLFVFLFFTTFPCFADTQKEGTFDFEMYDKKKTDSYNEKPWGFGFGKHIYEDDILRGLYFMVFSDSHSKPEPILGYLRQWNYYFDENKDFSVGAGYTLGVTFRDDYNYLPIPVILPIFGFQYKKLAVQATYIPGPYNMFNVLFTWVRIEL